MRREFGVNSVAHRDPAQERRLLSTIFFGVSWTAKKTNEWVLNEAGVKRGNC